MLERFTRNYCTCEEWESAEKHRWKELNVLLKQYPEQCPYCHARLKSESTANEVRIFFTYSTSDLYACELQLSLTELRELLKEIK